ncbi:MAG: uL15 family ribosomal protein [Candidatus Aenigmarchaeota archaeon]|nr:uL15 family ribosomal protein [Candidatus Aenigmarchaeota archaeon]MDI6722098.1 uL15 family ribosomal protein [Candidatus Aenigmarchaeota archaeon]
MTVRFRKKITRQRGSTSHGWGSKKKHRGGGSRGGRGMAGRHKHKYSYVVTKEPDYFGFRGFTSRKKKGKAINIDDMQKLSDETTIDLKSLGYEKLLSRGRVERAVTVKAAKFSAKAKEKIEAAGGQIISE